MCRNDENCTAINGVSSAFVATSGISLIALSEGIAVRGGLDVGIATQIDDREIYGPALEKAVCLESQMAEHPRFVLGNELRSYLTWVENQEYNSSLGQIAKNTARFCQEMIIRDTDRRYMLDFLGSRMKDAPVSPLKVTPSSKLVSLSRQNAEGAQSRQTKSSLPDILDSLGTSNIVRLSGKLSELWLLATAWSSGVFERDSAVPAGAAECLSR